MIAIKKRATDCPWRAFTLKAVILAVVLAIGFDMAARHYRLGIDWQVEHCLPDTRVVLINLRSDIPERGGLIAFHGRGLAPIFPDGTADDVFETFYPAAVNALFLGPGPDRAAANDAGRIGDVTLREAPEGETALSLVANAYSTSASETIPAKPAPLVDEDDVATAAHDGARNCLLVGSQCTEDSFGACISRDRVLCCFNSPLGRLTQEAAVPQFGRDFGSAKAPDCRGLTSGEIQHFDWTMLDLDQWIAIIGTAERYPDLDKLTPGGLAGTGNFLNLVDPDEPRPGAVSRTQQRLERIDPGCVRRCGRDEIKREGS